MSLLHKSNYMFHPDSANWPNPDENNAGLSLFGVGEWVGGVVVLVG